MRRAARRRPASLKKHPGHTLSFVLAQACGFGAALQTLQMRLDTLPQVGRVGAALGWVWPVLRVVGGVAWLGGMCACLGKLPSSSW